MARYKQWRVFTAVLLVAAMAIAVFALLKPQQHVKPVAPTKVAPDNAWVAPEINNDSSLAPETKTLLLYGEELITHTAKYFGPKGIVSNTSNGMNCQNCHLDAGRKSWGNNFGAVAANYPRFNPRAGRLQTIYGRINDCFQRSLNGHPVETATREMQAMFAYIAWLGRTVALNSKPVGSGVEKIAFINRAASPDSGKLVYAAKCAVCHGKSGGGLLTATGMEYAYPPLWGANSYNTGAGLYRLSGFAGFVKNNMPYLQATHSSPLLTISQAWDVAAFVNTQPRPSYDQQNDWKDIKRKPFDFPFGPYADTFSQQQHKYGPFQAFAMVKK